MIVSLSLNPVCGQPLSRLLSRRSSGAMTTASSIFVTPWKCAEFGILKQRMPWEWRHSLKCWSKARRPQYDASPQISHLNS